MKKLLATILALVMALSVTTAAWADSTAEVSTAAEFKDAVKKASDAIQSYTLKGNITIGDDTHDDTWGYEIRFAAAATKVTIDGQNHTLTLAGKPSGYSWPNQTAQSPAGFTFVDTDANNHAPAGKTIIFKNVNFVNNKDASEVTTGSERFTKYIYARAENVIYENCTFNGGVVVYGNATFTNCEFKESSSGKYCLFIDHEYATEGAYAYKMDNCSFDGSNSAYGLLKVAADRGADVDVAVTDTTFKNIANKPAINVNGDTDLTIGGEKTEFVNCTHATSNLGGAEAAGKIPTITVTGGSYTQDVTEFVTGAEAIGTTGTESKTYLVGGGVIANAANSGSVVTVTKGGTIDGLDNGVTVAIGENAGTVTINGKTVTGTSYTVPAAPRYYYNSTTTTTTDTKADGTKGSPKTFDAGVGIYAVSALLSVTGMAYVGKKKF